MSQDALDHLEAETVQAVGHTPRAEIVRELADERRLVARGGEGLATLEGLEAFRVHGKVGWVILAAAPEPQV